MKNVKRRIVSLAVVMALLVCAVVTPALTVSADRNIYTYLEEKELGIEWDAWNSMNNTNFDANDYKIPTAEYIEVVNDPTNSGRGGVLKIGHADYKTSLSLRVTQETSVNYSHKLETLLYLDGTFESANILIRDRDIWDNSTPYDQSSVSIIGMEKGKWVTLNTENVAAGVDGLSGRANHHIHDGTITVIFDVTLEKGNYLYMDDLNIAAGNSKTYLKNIDTEKGDKIIYSHQFKTFEELEVTPVTELEDWTVSAKANVGQVTTNGNTELVIYSGSITQIIDGLPNGAYNISVDYCSNGNTSSILSAHDVVGTEWKNQRNLIIQDTSYGMHTATMNGYNVTDNCLRISVWVGAQEGKLIKIDNITVTNAESNKNYVLNGDFEYSDAPIVGNPPKKADRTVGWGNWISGVGEDSIYVTNMGYKSNSSMAVTYPVDGGSNISHKITGLTAGKTYVITSNHKMSANTSVTLFIKYQGGQTKKALTTSEVWTSFSKDDFTLPEGCDWFTLEYYCGGKAGDWFMLDNVKVYDKDDALKTNLVTNGDFEEIIGDLDGNSIINVSDLTSLRNTIMNSASANISIADVNADAKVDALDVVRIKKSIAGLDVILGEK